MNNAETHTDLIWSFGLDKGAIVTIAAVLVPWKLLRTRQPHPSTTAVLAAATLIQNVLRLRAATRNSRFTMGSALISHS